MEGNRISTATRWWVSGDPNAPIVYVTDVQQAAQLVLRERLQAKFDSCLRKTRRSLSAWGSLKKLF